MTTRPTWLRGPRATSTGDTGKRVRIQTDAPRDPTPPRPRLPAPPPPPAGGPPSLQAGVPQAKINSWRGVAAALNGPSIEARLGLFTRWPPTAVGGSARFGHAIGSRLSGLPSLAFLVSIHVTGGTSRIQDLASARAATRLGWLRAELRARCAYPRPRGADPERTPICIWVSSTGFRQPGLLCAFRRRLVTVHVSPVSPSLTKEGNAACARQVCRKVTTRETRDQRRISTWYQNLRVLSAQSSGRSPEG